MSSQEKTEEPTPRRYEEARSRGHVPHSQEINSAAVLLAGFLVLQSLGAQAFSQLSALMRSSFQQIAIRDLTPQMIGNLTVESELAILRTMAPLLATIILVGIAVNVAQTRFLLTGHPLQPDLNRINPLNGLKRLFSSRSLVELAKALVKAAVIGAVVYRSFVEQFPQMVALSRASLPIATAALGKAALSIGTSVGVALLFLAAIDYLYQRREYILGIRMTRQELREELKHSEGSPELRARIRQLQRQLAQGRSLPKVRQADVVVANPTHYAVALQYKPLEMRAPKVVSKGRGLIAQQIRRIAAEAGVPIVTNPPLAQALYRAVELGHEVPVDLYHAVAELLAFIYSLRGGRIGR